MKWNLTFNSLFACRNAPKKRKVTSDEVDMEILRQLQSIDKDQKDEEDLYEQSVAASLRTMNPQQKRRWQK